VRLGAIALWGADVGDFRAQARTARELGYEILGVGESPAAWQDMIVSLAVAAGEVPGMTLLTAVTAPFMRHPLVLARAMLSLAELSGGEVIIGFGGGGSAPAALGRGGATLTATREYVLALRAILNGESVGWEGSRTAPLVGARPLRIFIAANGPRQLRLAAEVGDGVIINLGSAMDIVDSRLAEFRDAAREAGRDADALEVWGMTYAAVRDTREAAIDDIAAFLAVTGSLGMKRKYLRDLVPPALREPIEQLRAQYDPTDHVVVGGRMARAVKELGLTDFLAGLSAVAGTPSEVHDTVAELGRRGVSAMLAGLPGQADPLGTLRRFAAALTVAGG
jgi:alkanesulfonate monooxygenase SsuD/methylene tetrahydromethanopterin reductase-like flavin-dependent oxidoreductase (luciferase family)